MRPRYTVWVSLLGLGLMVSCASYYQRNIKFNQFVETGQLDRADETLGKDKKAEKRKTRLLYYMNRGLVGFLKGEHAKSNEYFEKAYLFVEDYQKNYVTEGFSLLTNPKFVPYQGETFEVLLIHYYKALNFLMLGERSKALVECRRLINKQNYLSDRYQGKNKYKTDAFILNLIGIIFEANGDINDAFISYRNAYEAYENDYKELFGMGAPDQLKEDLLRTAYYLGFQTELDQYKRAFNRPNYKPERHTNHGELIFFWHNGMGPVKDEWSINFVAIEGQGGVLNFQNEELGLNFAFSDYSNDGEGGLGDLKTFRVAFPKYVERKPVFNSAVLRTSNGNYPLHMAEDINAIAFQSLRDRMIKEFGKGLLRLALKKAAEAAARKQNEATGAILGAVNFISEQADTRNWQTLPYAIHYTRAYLPEGENNITLEVHGGGNTKTHKLDLTIKKGRTQFQSFRHFDAEQANIWY